MSEIIASIVLICGLLGMGTVVFRKIPILIDLPKKIGKPQENLLSRLKRKWFLLFSEKSFSFEIFLQKFLSKIRILTLRTDQKTSLWLQKLRERAQRNRLKGLDDYWQELKKSTKKR